MIKKVIFSVLFLNIGLMLGRLSGFVRESIVAATYGTTSQADTMVLMLTVPDMLVNILVGGAMGAVLIPEFSSNPDRAKILLIRAIVFFGSIFTLISIILYWQSYALVGVLAPGFSDAQILESSKSLGWVLWLIPLTVVAGVVTAYLHFKGRFVVSSLGTLIVNSSIIIGLLLAYFEQGSIFLVAVFVLIGGVLRLISQLITADIRLKFSQLFNYGLLSKGILSRYLQALLSGSILLFIPVMARAFASYSGEGSVAIMNYSTRLIEFPLAIAITIFAVVLLPRLSNSFIENQNLYKQLAKYGIQATLAISLLIMVSLILLSEHYVDVVFGHGNMHIDDLNVVQRLVEIGLVSLPFQGISFFFTAIFHSQKNAKVPLIINILGILVFLIIYIGNVFGSALDSIMWGVLSSYVFICTLQVFMLKTASINLNQFLFNKEFILGLLSSLVALYWLTSWVAVTNFNSMQILLISTLIGIFSLAVFAAFNQDVKNLARDRAL